MKECNKKIYDKIQEYLDSCLTTFVEIVIEYKDDLDRNLHQVVQYNRTANDAWLGVVGNMFDFDFFDCKEVVSFVPFCNLMPTENTVISVDEDDEDEAPSYEEADEFDELDLDSLQDIADLELTIPRSQYQVPVVFELTLEELMEMTDEY